MHLRMLQKIPIKLFSNKFCQPWKSEMAALRTQASSCLDPCTVNLKMWNWECRVRDLVWLCPRYPPAAGVGVALRGPGGSFPVLRFPKEEWLLFSCLCYLLDKTFMLVFGSLKDAGAQRRFPLLRNNLSQSPFPNPALFQGLAVARISCLLIASIMLERFIV